MILDKKNESPTIESALRLVDSSAESFEDWKTKGLGLRLVLLGLAEVQALRLSKLAGIVCEVENNLLSTDMINDLEPKQLFQLYQLSTKALTESSEFVERTLKTVSWSDLEEELLQVKAQEVNNGKNSGLDSSTAQDLLSALAKLQAGETLQ